MPLVSWSVIEGITQPNELDLAVMILHWKFEVITHIYRVPYDMDTDQQKFKVYFHLEGAHLRQQSWLEPFKGYDMKIQYHLRKGKDYSGSPK